MIVRRDGRLAMVTKGKSSGGLACELKCFDNNEVSHLWVKTGTDDCTEGSTRRSCPQDAIADAKLTLPLTVGQRVIRRDGVVVTVEVGCTSDIVELRHDGHSEGNCAVFKATGFCSGVSDRMKVEANEDEQHHWDAVADAPAEEPVDWSKPIVGMKLDGTLVEVMSHRKADKVRPYQRQVNFKEGVGNDVKTPCGALRGFCYLESGVHHKYPDEMPVIRNI